MEIADRILSLRLASPCKNAAVILHYTSYRAFLLLLIGDTSAAASLAGRAVDDWLEQAGDRPDVYSLCVCGRACALKWRFSRRESDFARAIGYFDEALHVESLTDLGRTEIEFEVGGLYRDKGDYAAAVQHLDCQRWGCSNPLSAIHLAEVYVRMEKIDCAKSTLKTVDMGEVDPANRLEYLGVLCAIAIRDHDREGANAIAAKLRALDLPDLYFQRTRDHLIIEVLSCFGPSRPFGTPSDGDGPLARVWAVMRQIAQYLELKPNICGVGLNLNRLFEAPRRADDQAEGQDRQT